MLFLNDYNDFNKRKNDKTIDDNSIVFLNKPNHTVTESGIYLNCNRNKYFKNLTDKDFHIKVIKEINKYYSFSGVLSYFLFADILLNNNEVLKDEVIQELTAVVFWKYFCDKSDIPFYK